MRKSRGFNVLLVAPPWGNVYGRFRALSRRINFHPPMGLCYLAASLAAAGHRARVLDAEVLAAGEILREAASGVWDVVGISATTPIYPSAVALAGRIKERFRGPVVLGGPHPTICRVEALPPSGRIDYLVCGEGERTFPALLSSLADGGDPRKVQGIVFRDAGGPVFTGEAPRETDLDRIPYPDRSHLEPGNYLWSVPRRGLVPTTSVLFSRGCPYECTFCSQRHMYGSTVRWRSPGNLLDELDMLLGGTPYRHFVFLDDTLTADRGRIVRLLRGIVARGYRATFEGETRANLLDHQLVELMREAGFVRMNIGIESGDPEMLKRLKTGVTHGDIERALRLLKAHGIETRGTVILGTPYERKETVRRTVEYLANLRDLDQPYISVAAPYPGTAIREQALRGEGGARLLHDDYGSLLRYGGSAMEVNDLTAADLVAFQARGLRRAYLQPRRLLYNFLRAGVSVGIRNGLAFLGATIGGLLRRRVWG